MFYFWDVADTDAAHLGKYSIFKNISCIQMFHA